MTTSCAATPKTDVRAGCPEGGEPLHTRHPADCAPVLRSPMGVEGDDAVAVMGQ
jgi:hypothetical protein